MSLQSDLIAKRNEDLWNRDTFRQALTVERAASVRVNLRDKARLTFDHVVNDRIQEMMFNRYLRMAEGQGTKHRQPAPCSAHAADRGCE